ncbi:sensor histidine kinase [Tepidibacter aestuarii]|uniref:sensor histidine kinase n=1 Tax=Tepidibacter aestuarii TaxID=2925782 RepID=UPI0020BE49F2|nr:HAMP domain-containing sensor histidine kinase [Tepidibacter aestuarii]CAH2214551.1 Histidine kinase [Tepidibacter aestuarii]
MKLSIKLKSSVFLGVHLLLTVSVLSILVLHGIEKYQKKQYEDYLMQQAKIANVYIRQVYLTDGTKEDPKKFFQKSGRDIAMQLGTMSGMHVILYDIAGKNVGDSAPFINEIDTLDALSFTLKDKIAYEVTGDSLYYLAPIHINDYLYDTNEQIGVVQFHYSLKNSINFYKNIKNLLYRIGICIFIFSFTIAYFYNKRFVEVIVKLKKTIEKIKMGKFDEVTLLKRKDELGDLSQGIYYMSCKIEKNIIGMKEEQQKLRLAIEKLKILEQQQQQFIGNVTHEFKTPLTVIKAYVDLIEMYKDDEQLLEDGMLNIKKETERLYDMVEKVLRLASLEKYDFEMQSEKIQVEEVLQDICGRMKGKAEKFGISLYEELHRAVIIGDKECFMRIFINLLDNAIKYNEPGGKIIIKNYIRGKNVCIEVKDTGIGIPMEVREKIFEPFYTVNKDRSRQSGGTGLGLTLVKELVEKQKGKIELLNTEKEGSTFLISFPLFG